MPWIAFTTDDVKARLYDVETEACEDVAGSVERLPLITDQVRDRFRGAIRSNPRVSEMGPAGTLPDFCISDAAIIARMALVGLSPVTEGVTDPRRDEYNAARNTLENLSIMDPKAFGNELPTSTSNGPCASYGGARLLDF